MLEYPGKSIGIGVGARYNCNCANLTLQNGDRVEIGQTAVNTSVFI